MALGGHAWQQHPFSPERSYFVSENAVDGLYDDRSPFGNQCTLSDNYRYTAEWRVDLGSVFSISHVNIIFRTDNLPSLNTLLIYKKRLVKLSILEKMFSNIMVLTKCYMSNLVSIGHSNIFYPTDNFQSMFIFFKLFFNIFLILYINNIHVKYNFTQIQFSELERTKRSKRKL